MVFLIVNHVIVHQNRYVKRIRVLVFVHHMLPAKNVTNVNHIHLVLINFSAVNCAAVNQWVYKIMIFNVICIMVHARTYLNLRFPFLSLHPLFRNSHSIFFIMFTLKQVSSKY